MVRFLVANFEIVSSDLAGPRTQIQHGFVEGGIEQEVSQCRIRINTTVRFFIKTVFDRAEF